MTAQLPTPAWAYKFRWLKREFRGQTYNSGTQFSHLPSCSFDWGQDGYGGCCNNGNELLYLSVQSKQHGVIMARGHFATSLYASLSRTQIEFGGPSTFGLEVSVWDYTYNPGDSEVVTVVLDMNGNERTEVGKEVEDGESTQATGSPRVCYKRKKSNDPRPVEGGDGEGHYEILESTANIQSASNGSSFKLGRMIERGCFNYRWPFAEYYLDLHVKHVEHLQDMAKRKIAELKSAAKRAIEAANRVATGEPSQAKSAEEIAEEYDDLIAAEEIVLGLDKENTHVGTCQMFSCARGKMFYQILRIEEGIHSEEGTQTEECGEAKTGCGTESEGTETSECSHGGEGSGSGQEADTQHETPGGSNAGQDSGSRVNGNGAQEFKEWVFPRPSKVVLTMGGPVWFQTFNEGDHLLREGDGKNHFNVPDNVVDDSKFKRPDDPEPDDPRPDYIRYFDKDRGIAMQSQLYRLVPSVENTENDEPNTQSSANSEMDNRAASGEKWVPIRLTRSYTNADSAPREARGKKTTYAYNAIQSITSENEGGKQPKSVTFVASIYMYECKNGTTDQSSLPSFEPPSSKDLFDHIGAHESSPRATGMLWDSIFLEPPDESEFSWDLAQVSIAARSLEKIVQVDMIPAYFRVDGSEDEVGDREKNAADDEAKNEGMGTEVALEPKALVSNMFVHARNDIDWRSIFWKIRFLVRVHKFFLAVQKKHDNQTRSRLTTESDGLQKAPAVELETRDTAKTPASQHDAGDEEPRGTSECQSVDCTSQETPTSQAENNSPEKAPVSQPGTNDPQRISDRQYERRETQLESSLLKELIKRELKRTKEAIQSVLLFLVKSMLKKGTECVLLSTNRKPGDSDYFYVLPTIWYVLRNFHDWDWKFLRDQFTTADSRYNSGRLYSKYRLPEPNWSYDTQEREMVLILQWYHYGSLLKLWDFVVDAKATEQDEKRWLLPRAWKSHCETCVKPKLTRCAKAARMASAASLSRLSTEQPYKAEDEIFDSLSLLADELGLEGKGESGAESVGAVGNFSMQRIKRREPTRYLNPGYRRRGATGSTSGPWEIHVLCHHSRLVVLTKEEKLKQDWRTRKHTNEEADRYKHDIYRFLNAEGTLVPCWERSHTRAKKAWLRSETTAAVASTFLIMHEKSMKTTGTGQTEQVAQGTGSKKTDPTRQYERLLETYHIEMLMNEQLEILRRSSDEAQPAPPIDWLSFSPPRQYHPREFLESLEDTPDLYTKAELEKRPIPASLRSRLVDKEDPSEWPIFSRQSIRDVINMRCLFLADIRAVRPVKTEAKLKAKLKSRPRDRTALPYVALGSEVTRKDRINPPLPDDDVEGYSWSNVYHPLRSPEDDEESPEATSTGMITPQDSRLEWALYDSLVDREVQHRFLLVRKGSKAKGGDGLGTTSTTEKTQLSEGTLNRRSSTMLSTNRQRLTGDVPKPRNIRIRNLRLHHKTLQLLVYIFHPASALCLGNHCHNFTAFSCERRETWVASITLRSWRVDLKDRQESTVIADRGSARGASVGTSPPAQDGNSGPAQNRKQSSPRLVDDTDVIEDPPECMQNEELTEEDKSIQPPQEDKLRRIWEMNVEKGHRNMSFNLEMSSIILSTNNFGDFSKCTIVTELFDRNNPSVFKAEKSNSAEEQTGGSTPHTSTSPATTTPTLVPLGTHGAEGNGDRVGDLEEVVEHARKLWQIFIHQPQTGRCLVFLLILGKLCQLIHDEYKEAIKYLKQLLPDDDDESFTKIEEHWQRDKNTLGEFKIRVWTLQALYRLHNDLQMSLDSIQAAKKSLIDQIQAGPGKRSPRLERRCQEQLSIFEGRLMQLVTVHERLTMKIENMSRLKIGAEAVLNMRDSRTSLLQNATVQRLTYLTIGYLPAALMAAIFAIPTTQHVFPGKMNRVPFITGLVVLSLCTWTLAFFIQKVLTGLGNALKIGLKVTQYFSKTTKQAKAKTQKRPPDGEARSEGAALEVEDMDGGSNSGATRNSGTYPDPKARNGQYDPEMLGPTSRMDTRRLSKAWRTSTLGEVGRTFYG